MNITKETPQVPFVIQGKTFLVYQPYVEGHVNTAGESSALNQTLAENTRNNLASEAKEGKLTQTRVNEYITGYNFGVSSGRGPSTDFAAKADLAYMSAFLDSKNCPEIHGLKTQKAKAEKVAEFYETFGDSAGIFLHICGIACHGQPKGSAQKLFDQLWVSHLDAIESDTEELKAEAKRKAEKKARTIGMDLSAA